MTSTEASRLEKRRAETRARILHVAAKRFAEHGIDEVRLDELCGHADVSRGTLYNYFPAKGELIAAIMLPVLVRGIATLTPLMKLPARKAVEGVVELYLELYREFPDALRVAYQMQGGSLEQLGPEVGAKHMEFLVPIVAIFDKAAQRGILRAADGRTAARAMASVAVPLLTTFAATPGGEKLFRDSLLGLLLKDAGD